MAIATMMARQHSRGNETIHSGHFMVSQFEADAQDDEYQVAVPVPEVSSKKLEIIPQRFNVHYTANPQRPDITCKIMSVSIETSLSKLFQCMSIAYRQKLTSPKWNRFKGVRLRWKDKIRLNNVIWRCWHIQSVIKKNIGVCQFASPLDVDIHNKPEAVVLEGKYWKRKLNAVTAEYKKWRIFYRNRKLGTPTKEGGGGGMFSLSDSLGWHNSRDGFSLDGGNMLIDEDYMEFMSDTLFSSISAGQPFAFPDTREIARGASIADFIQPSLVQLQPNLEDFMDSLEPLQDLLSSKLPSVPEEYHPSDDLCRSLNANYQQDISTARNFFGQPSTSSGVSTTAAPVQKFYFKNRLEEPLQLSVPESGKNMYRISSNFQMDNNSKPNTFSASCYPNQNVSTAFQHHHQFNQQQQQIQQSNLQIQQMQQPVIQTLHPPPPPPPSQQSLQHNDYAINYSQNMKQSPPSMPAYSMNQSSGYDPYVSYMPQNVPNNVNYKITLPSSVKVSARKEHATGENLLKKESFAVPKQLSHQRRSRSGSSLINSQQSVTPHDYTAHTGEGSMLTLTQLLTNNNKQPHYLGNTPVKYAGSSGASSSISMNADSSGNTSSSSVNSELMKSHASGASSTSSHRPVAHCTALLGRRSRTPDHVLSSNANPVGYCKPRNPMFSSQKGSTDLNRHSESYSGSQTSLGVYGGTTGAASATTAGSSSRRYKTPYDRYPNPAVAHASSVAYRHQGNSPPAFATPFLFSSRKKSVEKRSDSNLLVPPKSKAETLVQPQSKSKSAKRPAPHRERRRVSHINAEQKRRCNIKNGFDTLHRLIPQLAQNPNSKISKAGMLQKGADYIRQLRLERNHLQEEIDSLKQQVESLNASIQHCQSLLPITGAPVTRHHFTKMKDMFSSYVCERTKENWKFWIFGLIFEPLLATFNAAVSTTSMEELVRTTMQWAEQNCTLVDLRPLVLNALRKLSTSTEILTEPRMLPNEIKILAARKEQQQQQEYHQQQQIFHNQPHSSKDYRHHHPQYDRPSAN